MTPSAALTQYKQMNMAAQPKMLHAGLKMILRDTDNGENGDL